MEQAFRELDSQMEELRKVQEEQDVLAAKTAEVTTWLLYLYSWTLILGNASSSSKKGKI